ncbi:MAG: hypothetical protein V3T14_01840 [Myxococcota bacterium]
MTTHDGEPQASRRGSFLIRTVPWLLAVGCFYIAYSKIAGTAAREGLTAFSYLIRFFAGANWLAWLGLMVPYSVFFFLVDSFATCQVINWFNTRVRYVDILPVRASTYILAILNEQVGKGAMAVYLYRRNRVPGWEVGSSMLFIAFVEVYHLLMFSSVGVFAQFELVRRASTLLPLDRIFMGVYVGAVAYLLFHLLYFSGRLLPSASLRERPIFHAFRRAAAWRYLALVLLKAPNLLAAVGVYTVALKLFRVDVSFGQILAFLPVIFLAAALPLPFHAGALALWVVLFPEFPEVSAFSLVMHTFFVVFNALIGLAFLPRANRELFGENEPAPTRADPSRAGS